MRVKENVDDRSDELVDNWLAELRYDQQEHLLVEQKYPIAPGRLILIAESHSNSNQEDYLSILIERRICQ